MINYIIYYILNDRMDIIYCRDGEELRDNYFSLRRNGATVSCIKNMYGTIIHPDNIYSL